MLDFLYDFWPHIFGLLAPTLALLASANAVLYKRDTRAAIGWVGLIWLVPFIGAVLYVLLGINRIQRRAYELRQFRPGLANSEATPACDRATFAAALDATESHFLGLLVLTDRATQTPLTAGNRIEALQNGDEAYPLMLAAIDQASTSIALSTYIFDHDVIGLRFVAALEQAVTRGVEVRVLIDGVGVLYSLPQITYTLRRHHIPVARFLSSLRPWRMPYMNLRNHRKLLIVDGRIGFTGGINIRAGNMLASAPKKPIRDLHFRLQGPVVTEMMTTFAEDWGFTTGERLSGAAWFPPCTLAGQAFARGIAAGPDEDIGKLRWTILGALNHAQKTVRIVTPYFLPDQILITAIMVAAMRGVQIDIVLPAVNNLPYIQWAATAQLWQFLSKGCRISLTPVPFDHTKLMVVDRIWLLLGSANWDQRSLRLNFEFNVECYDRALATELDRLAIEKFNSGRQLTLVDVDNRSLLVKLRDSTARLFSPYL